MKNQARIDNWEIIFRNGVRTIRGEISNIQAMMTWKARVTETAPISAFNELSNYAESFDTVYELGRRKAA